ALIRRLVTVATAVRDTGVPLAEGHSKLAHRKGFGERHAVLRAFTAGPPLLARRRAHDERSRWNDDHLRTRTALLECVLRLGRAPAARGGGRDAGRGREYSDCGLGRGGRR